MNYKIDIIDLLRDFFDSISVVSNIINVSTTGNTHVVEVDDLFYMQRGLEVYIDNKKYLIDNISYPDNKVTLKGAAITSDKINVYKFYFFHGTPIQQGVELNQEKKAANKTPMIWLYEQFTQRFPDDESINVERTADIRLFFLTQAENDKWLTEDSYHEAIKPMTRLAELIIERMKTYTVNCERVFDDTIPYDLINYHKFGVFISSKGMENSLWDDQLAGVECSTDLIINKTSICN